MNVQNINSNNSYISYRGADRHKNNRNVKQDVAGLTTDLIVSGASFSVFKNITQFSSVTELFKKGLGKKTTGIALAASVLTGTALNPILSYAMKPFVGSEKKEQKHSLLNKFALGALNGLASPLLATSHILLTLPALAGITTSARYLSERNDNKNLNEYLQIQKHNAGLHLLGTALGLGALATGGKGAIKAWNFACKKAKENNEALKAFKNPYGSINMEEITRRMGKSTMAKVKNKLVTVFLNFNENTIVDSNIFVTKWLQTLPDKKIDGLKEIGGFKITPEMKNLIKKLKGVCPRTYTNEEAQALITKTYGKKYSIVGENPLGVGTIAETYLAKENKTGNEVVIKFLKKGINKEKIEADREQAHKLLAKSEIAKNKEDFEYLKKYIDVMFSAWSKECDLSLEKEAAEIMAQNAKRFNVVKPMEIKDNIYVMEKANGVRLNQLDEYLQTNNVELTEEQVRKLLLNYNRVFIEQLISIPRSGQKIVQADPNSANIFIDIKNLEKPITFLDLGNVLRYDNLTATRNALGHLDFIFGNSRSLARTNLEGAILPEGMSHDTALEKLTAKLDEHIFNNKTRIPPPNTINEFCTQVMREMKIIPNADNANLIKAETTYFSNIFELRNKIQEGLVREINKNHDFGDKLKTMLTQMKESGDFKLLVRAILSEIFHSVKNASFKTQKHALKEVQEKIRYINENKERALTTFYGLIN